MNSVLGNLFLALQQRIKTNVPAVRWIDQDFGQIDFVGERPQVSFPCVLFDFEDGSFEELGNLAQTGIMTVAVRLAFAPYSNSNHLTPTAYREKALQFYEIEQQLYLALQGWQTDETGPFIRVKAFTEKRKDDLRVRQMVFTVAWEDYTAAAMLTTQLSQPDITGEFTS